MFLAGGIKKVLNRRITEVNIFNIFSHALRLRQHCQFQRSVFFFTHGRKLLFLIYTLFMIPWPPFEAALSISAVCFLLYTWQEATVSYLHVYDPLTSRSTNHQALSTIFNVY